MAKSKPAGYATVIAIKDVKWIEYEIPGGSPPVRLARFSFDPEIASFWVLVEFPPLWTRGTAGYYEAAEEMFVLDGSLDMSGATYGANDHVWFPAGYVRADSRSDGFLAWAWFGGRYRWHASTTSPDPYDSTEFSRASASDTPLVPAPFGVDARRLRDAHGVSSWLAPSDAAELSSDAGTLEIFSVPARSFAVVPPGRRSPELPGPCFVRLTTRIRSVARA